MAAQLSFLNLTSRVSLEIKDVAGVKLGNDEDINDAFGEGRGGG